MGDENSLQGRTQAHKHSSASSDGSFLSTGITGVTNLSNGSLVFGDVGEIVTELNAGNLGDILTMGATLPQWSPPTSAGQIQLVNHTELSGSATEIDTTFPAISGNDIACLLVYVNAVPDGANDVQCQINGLNSNYFVEGQKIAGGSQTLVDLNSVASFRVAQHEGANKAQTSVINIFVGNDAMTTTSPKIINYMVSGHSDAGASIWENGCQQTLNQTELTEVRIFVNAGNLLAGSSLSIFRVNNS